MLWMITPRAAQNRQEGHRLRQHFRLNVPTNPHADKTS